MSPVTKCPITWRPYRTADGPALRRIEAQQSARTGFAARLGDLDAPLTVFCQVAERDGQVIGALLAQATVEMLAVGTNAALLRSALRHRGALRRDLAAHGIAEVYVWEQRSVLKKLEPLLRRFGLRRLRTDFVPLYGRTSDGNQ